MYYYSTVLLGSAAPHCCYAGYTMLQYPPGRKHTVRTLLIVLCSFHNIFADRAVFVVRATSARFRMLNPLCMLSVMWYVLRSQGRSLRMSADGPSNRAQFLSSAGIAAVAATSAVIMSPSLALAEEEEVKLHKSNLHFPGCHQTDCDGAHVYLLLTRDNCFFAGLQSSPTIFACLRTVRRCETYRRAIHRDSPQIPSREASTMDHL